MCPVRAPPAPRLAFAGVVLKLKLFRYSGYSALLTAPRTRATVRLAKASFGCSLSNVIPAVLAVPHVLFLPFGSATSLAKKIGGLAI